MNARVSWGQSLLLRRITKHVRDQNWFAVGIDFCIVVIGVFIGLQVSNWNEARRDNEADWRALNDLLSESEQAIVAIKTEMNRVDAELVRRTPIVEKISNGVSDGLDEDEIAWAMGSARQYPMVMFSTTIYDALLGDGTLHGLAERDAIKSVTDFYAERAQFINTLEYFQYFVIEEYPHLSKYDGVTAIFDPDTDDKRRFRIDIDIALSNEDFREDAVNWHRNQVNFQSVRSGLLEGAIEMCNSLAAEVRRACQVEDKSVDQSVAANSVKRSSE